MASRRKAPGPRLWPAAVVVAGAALALVWIWRRPDSPAAMSQATLTLLVGLVAALLLVAWWLFFSRTGLFARLAVAAALFALGATASLVVEVRGLSGDLVPRLAWRGSAPSPPPADPPAAAPAGPLTPEPVEASPGEAAPGPEPAAPGSAPGSDAAPSPDALPAAPAAPDARSFPQFLGPGRDATLPGPRLDRRWDERPPVALWRQPIGRGWSGFAVKGDLAVTLEQREGREMAVAYGLEDGKVRWRHTGGAGFESAMAGDGPRATPTIHDGRVYAFGVNGVLTALDLASGRVLFERDVLSENGARRPDHGAAASPLVVDDLVVVLAGGLGGRSLVAYDRRSGEPRWSGGDDPAAYSSPRMATLAGVPQIVVFTQRSLVGHDPRTGEVLWRDPWPERSEKVSQPVLLEGDRLFASMGYGVGGRLVRVSRDERGAFRADALWDTRQLKAKFTQVVAHRGFLYGLDEGVLVCLDPETGERRWKSGRYGHGQVLLVGDLLLVQAEDGRVVLVDPGPERLVELARFQAVDGRAWATPALVGDLLLVRGDVEAACYRLAVEDGAGAAIPPSSPAGS